MMFVFNFLFICIDMNVDMDMDSEIEAINETPSTTNLEKSATSLPPLPQLCLEKRKHRKSLYVWEHFTIIGDPKDEDVRCT